MIEPVASQNLLIAAAAGALVILFGGGYALLFALARLRRHPGLHTASLACYGGLAIATLTLGRVLNLEGPWAALVVVMLAGYLVAPHLIWWLCVGTHQTVASPNRRQEHG